MKREREVDSKTMANYLMFLSRGGATSSSTYLSSSSYSNNRVFECKTCNRRFPSFQALGGHRASHKKPRFMGGSEGENSDGQLLHGSVLSKPKTHECSICGLEFAIGQALGGHMRRHRTAAAASNGNMKTCMTMTTTTSTTSGSSVDHTSPANRKNKGNSRRVLFPDLNLTSLENDLKFLKIGQPTPLVYCFN